MLSLSRSKSMRAHQQASAIVVKSSSWWVSHKSTIVIVHVMPRKNHGHFIVKPPPYHDATVAMPLHWPCKKLLYKHHTMLCHSESDIKPRYHNEIKIILPQECQSDTIIIPWLSHEKKHAHVFVFHIISRLRRPCTMIMLSYVPKILWLPDTQALQASLGNSCPGPLSTPRTGPGSCEKVRS